MAKKASPIADLDIAAESLTQQDGLAERVARNRAGRGGNSPSPLKVVNAAVDMPPDRNQWRNGKSVLQVAIPEDSHVELSVIAKRRRTTLSQIVKDALHDWLEKHGHPLRLD